MKGGDRNFDSLQNDRNLTSLISSADCASGYRFTKVIVNPKPKITLKISLRARIPLSSKSSDRKCLVNIRNILKRYF